MANLKNKHFGDKVFLSDLKSKIVKEMLIIPNIEKSNKIPNFGWLTRYEDGTVGISVQWYDGEGHATWIQEPTDNTTIQSWAESHD